MKLRTSRWGFDYLREYFSKENGVNEKNIPLKVSGYGVLTFQTRIFYPKIKIQPQWSANHAEGG